MSAVNSFYLIGRAASDFSTPFPNAKKPEQCFLLEVANGDAQPFTFAVFLNPISKFNELRRLKGKTVAVSGMVRGYLPAKPGALPITSLVAYDVRVIEPCRIRKPGDYA